MKHIGDLTINTAADAVKYAKVTQVTGFLCICAEATLPSLTTVCGGLSINEDATLPSLTTVGGGLSINAEATIPALTTVGGGLWIHAEATIPALTTVGGGLSIYAKATIPALTTVGGWMYIKVKATLPALTTAHGVPGRLLCVSTYGLWLGDNGLLYAGCRNGLTVQQALEHWDLRKDARAVMFTKSIKQIESKK